MIPHDELTRWNRAGLSSIEYVGGNAATFLERLRYLLAEEFENWQAIQVADIDTETDTKTQQRMLEQYHAERRDWAWELLRTFSRATHVLGAHINAYANEGYLGTATQWDNLRKLVEMLDYHPAPPASASTYLLMQAKPGAAGMMDAGFQVKYSPTDGSKAIVFETLEDVEVDARLNTLYVDGYGRSQLTLAGQDSLLLNEAIDDLEVGQPVLIEDEESGALLGELIAEIQTNEQTTLITLRNNLPTDLKTRMGYALVHVLPKESLSVRDPVSRLPRLEYGSRYFPLLEETHGLQQSDLLCISASEGEQYRLITKVDGAGITLKDAAKLKSTDGVKLARALELTVSSIVTLEEGDIGLWVVGDWSRLKDSLICLSRKPDDVAYVVDAYYSPVVEGGDSKTKMGYTLLTLGEAKSAKLPFSGSGSDKGWLLETKFEKAMTLYVPPANRGFEIDGYIAEPTGELPQELKADIIKKISAPGFVCMLCGDKLVWASLKSAAVNDAESMAEITVDEWLGDDGIYYQQKTRIQGAFKHQLRLNGWDINEQPVATTDKALQLNSDDLPDFFRTGRKVYVESVEGSGFVATIDKREGGTITLDRDIGTADQLTIANTRIRANIALIGHGERKPVKILGSGFGTEVNQSFVLKVANVAFISDPSQATGVRADVDVLVDGRLWEQVSTLRNSHSTDHHYTVRMTEDNYIRIGFGDGFKGRRLPSGRDNVRISYRVGAGNRGNLEAHKLEKPVKPHRLIEKVFQPMDSNGGNDMEGPDSLRSSAPSSLLSLERAVSLQDFANLTRNHSSVWDARAFAGSSGNHHQRSIDVVVVPAGGGMLNTALREELTSYLQEHAIPNIRVSLQDYEAAFLALNIMLRIDLFAYDPELVRNAVYDALVNNFKLSNRRIGQAIYQSDIYRVVESVTGVSSSTCHFAPQMFYPTIPARFLDVIKSSGSLYSKVLPQAISDVSKTLPMGRDKTPVTSKGPLPASASAGSDGTGSDSSGSNGQGSLLAIKGLDGSVRVVRPAQNQVLYLDEKNPALNIQYEDVER